jgi:hybrid cluster-associated redox disulfide protein
LLTSLRVVALAQRDATEKSAKWAFGEIVHMKTIAKNSAFSAISGDSAAAPGCAINQELLVDEVMRHWPQTIRVFLDFRFGCVGCPIACFHSVADAALEHGADCAAFVEALKVAVTGPALPRAN